MSFKLKKCENGKMIKFRDVIDLFILSYLFKQHKCHPNNICVNYLRHKGMYNVTALQL